MRTIIGACLLLAGCGGQVKESNEAAIANQAESLERAANATTDQMIGEIENAAKREEASAQNATAEPASASQP
jgi:hypothetical protein